MSDFFSLSLKLRESSRHHCQNLYVLIFVSKLRGFFGGGGALCYISRIIVSDYQILCALSVCSVCSLVSVYRYVPHNSILVDEGLHVRWWSHNIIILTIVLQLHAVFHTVTCCTGL